DVGQWSYGGRTWQRLRLVMTADAVDVAPAALCQPLRRLHAPLSDQDAQIGPTEPQISRTVDPQEERLVLAGDFVPVVAHPREDEFAVLAEVPCACPGCGQKSLDRIRLCLLHDQLRPNIDGGKLTPAVVDL